MNTNEKQQLPTLEELAEELNKEWFMPHGKSLSEWTASKILPLMQEVDGLKRKLMMAEMELQCCGTYQSQVDELTKERDKLQEELVKLQNTYFSLLPAAALRNQQPLRLDETTLISQPQQHQSDLELAVSVLNTLIANTSNSKMGELVAFSFNALDEIKSKLSQRN